MIYFKAHGTEYPAEIAGRVTDRDWDGRESKAVTLTISYADAAALFVDGVAWSIVQRERVPKLDEKGQETGQTEEYVQDWDNSDFCVAGPITDNRDGTCTCKMGKKTASDLLAELEATYDGN